VASSTIYVCNCCLHWFFTHSGFDLSDSVSLSPLRLPHPRGACDWSFVHCVFVRFWHPSYLPSPSCSSSLCHSSRSDHICILSICHPWSYNTHHHWFWAQRSWIQAIVSLIPSVCLLVCLSFLVSSCFSDSGCRVATLSNPFTGPLLEDLLALSLTYTQTLVSCSSPSSPKHLQREVLCEYPVVKDVVYWEVKGVCAGVAVLNPEYQDAHDQENQSNVDASCGFGLTYQSETRKVQGYCYLYALGRGSNSLIHPWFAPKA